MTFLSLTVTTSGAAECLWLVDGENHRSLLLPGDSIDALPDDLQAQLRALWTPEFVAAWKDAHGIAAPSLDDLRSEACARLRSIRWMNHASVVFDGVDFVSDDTAATRLVAAINARQTAQAMGLEPEDATASWEAKDGSMIPMTINDQRGLLMAGVAKTQTAFNRQAELMAEINAAETPEAVAAINLMSGWPE